MSFLTPLFLLGGLAIALPIVFHLIRRTTRDQVVFSSLMFLKPTPPRLTRRSRIDHLLLLLLRCLVLLLLALGFARPFFKRPMAAAPTQAERTRLVVLVDNSASMRREELWKEAMDRVEAVLRPLQPGDEAAILVFSQETKVVLSLTEWSALPAGERVGGALLRLRQITPSWSSTALGHGLIAAAELLDDASRTGDESGIRRIVLVSDMQEGSRIEGLQGYEWPRRLEVAVETIKPKKPTNAAMQLQSNVESRADDAGTATIRARLFNSSDARRESMSVRWSDGGASGEVYVPPGQSRAFTPPTPANPGSDRLLLTGDDHEFDNTLYLVPPRRETVKVLFLGNEEAADSGQSLYYLTRAFQAAQRQVVEIVARPAGAPVAPADTNEVHLAIVSDALEPDRLDLLSGLLRAGRTVLVVMRTPVAAATVARLAGVESVAAEEAAVSRYAMLGQVDFAHPLFAPFADARFSDFTKIHFWKYRRLDVTALPKARVLARFDGPQADPALVQIPVGSGSLFILTSGWFPADSQLALSSKFVPLLHSLLEQSGAVRAQTLQLTLGDPMTLPEGGAGPLKVRKPDGTEVATAPGTIFTQTDQPGHYSVSGGAAPFRFAVNLAAEESRTAPLEPETLQKLGVPLKVDAPTTPARARAEAERKIQLHSAELESRQKLWRWLIVGALVVLMLETWMAGRLTRQAGLPT